MALNVKGVGIVNGLYIRPKAILTGGDLERTDLMGADLEDANLTKASLFEANLGGAVLDGAILDEAFIMGASLRGAHLRKAKLRLARAESDPDSQLPRSSRVVTCFDGADLTEAVLYRAILNDTSLKNVKLNSADLTRTRFINSDLTGAFLEEATIVFTSFHKATLSNAHLNGCLIQSADMVKLTMTDAEAQGATFRTINIRNSDLSGTDFSNASFHRVIFDHAVLTGACFKGATFAHCSFIETDLTGVDFTGADLTDMDLSSATTTGAILTSAVLQNTLMPDQSVTKRRTYGVMTGPILKLNKPDAPVKASEFKRAYPAEFEKLKAASLGRDFTPSLKQSIKDRYVTPFPWVVVPVKYGFTDQRKSETQNDVLILAFNARALGLTDKILRAIMVLSRNLPSSPKHPKTLFPLFPVGWVRYSKDDTNKVLLIEEVQSDVDLVRGINRNQMSVVAAEERAEVASILQPYVDRFYEDAVGFVFEEAKALGYTVEMLGYEDKKGYRSPKSVYIDLPRRLGMSAKRVSKSAPNLQDRVSYYDPNPSRPKRWRGR
jgi:uncharacterized protein YjbI with pentapeptide repeats